MSLAKLMALLAALQQYGPILSDAFTKLLDIFRSKQEAGTLVVPAETTPEIAALAALPPDATAEQLAEAIAKVVEAESGN